MHVDELNLVALTGGFGMKAMVGIPIFNEEENIERLLNTITADMPREVEAIYVVSSGSNDNSNEIVTSYAQNDPRVHLITEKERKGKVSAFNILLAESEKYDAMIYLGGDNLPERDAMKLLLNELKNADVGIVGGRPIPIDNKNTFLGFCVHLLWNLHHLVSVKFFSKASGELMAFKSGILRQVPPALINDDLYTQFIFELKGHKVGYCPSAKVYLKGPSTLSDFICQRKRVYIGHRQINFLMGKIPSTMRRPKWGLILEACPFAGIKGRIYAIGFILLQSIALLLSKWDLYRQKLPYKWKIAETTKSLRYGI